VGGAPDLSVFAVNPNESTSRYLLKMLGKPVLSQFDRKKTDKSSIPTNNSLRFDDWLAAIEAFLEYEDPFLKMTPLLRRLLLVGIDLSLLSTPTNQRADIC
jgi:hypothetical protein